MFYNEQVSGIICGFTMHWSHRDVAHVSFLLTGGLTCCYRTLSIVVSFQVDEKGSKSSCQSTPATNKGFMVANYTGGKVNNFQLFPLFRLYSLVSSQTVHLILLPQALKFSRKDRTSVRHQ
ncbi:hypothetical protein NPIL_532501 [Nephila pilipes]|uniref:Uncharacterized protein n=1 Tax=Nephila pilipes TaxID=299642 RepID=A0A8X6UMH0_NEPPI|nr:hypothetical protein NPIL_532501 [Nephila pilipes]